MEPTVNDGASTQQIRITNLTKRFGGFVAVNDVTYTLNRNEIATVVGPNGAGKTTFFNLITGYFRPDEGSIFFEGKDITAFSPQQRVSLGLMRTFQLTSTFDNLRVIDNLVLAHFRRTRKDSIRALLFSTMKRSARSEEIKQHLEEFGLVHVAYRETATLSLGEKRRLEMAMAVIAQPKVLLLDEPFAGLRESEIRESLDVLRHYVHKHTILIVEHKISMIKELTERLTVFYQGAIIADGAFEEVMNSPQVRKSYWRID